MMYPFLQIDGDTEIVHSEMLPGGEVKVYVEKPDAKDGKCLRCNNNSQIPEKVLRNIIRVIEARSGEVIEKWVDFFGEATFFC